MSLRWMPGLRGAVKRHQHGPRVRCEKFTSATALAASAPGAPRKGPAQQPVRAVASSSMRLRNEVDTTWNM
eukprot:6173543-Pleurochrysis_carterae.AAC.4